MRLHSKKWMKDTNFKKVFYIIGASQIIGGLSCAAMAIIVQSTTLLKNYNLLIDDSNILLLFITMTLAFAVIFFLATMSGYEILRNKKITKITVASLLTQIPLIQWPNLIVYKMGIGLNFFLFAYEPVISFSNAITKYHLSLKFYSQIPVDFEISVGSAPEPSPLAIGINIVPLVFLIILMTKSKWLTHKM